MQKLGRLLERRSYERLERRDLIDMMIVQTIFGDPVIFAVNPLWHG